MISPKTYLKSAEVAELFDVNPSTISLWVKKGRLKPHKTLGGNFRFRTSDIEKLLGEQGGSEPKLDTVERRREPRFTFACPVLVRVGQAAFSFTYNAFIQDISGHGLRLVVFDTNGLAEKLQSGGVTDLTLLNLPDGLFKEVVVGHVEHFEKVGEREVAVGVSLDRTPRHL